MIRILERAFVGFLALIVVLIIVAWFVLLRPVAQPVTNDPLQVFDHGSIGNQAQQGIPYWIWRVLPTLFPEYLPGNQDGYGAIGVFWVPGEELPVGFSKKIVGVIPRVAPNCAFCHQGSYRLHPEDPATFVPAGAGTRVNVQGFIRLLVAIGRHPERFTADRVMTAITAIYDMPFGERLSTDISWCRRSAQRLWLRRTVSPGWTRVPNGVRDASTRSTRSSSSICACPTTTRSAIPTSCRCGT